MKLTIYLSLMLVLGACNPLRREQPPTPDVPPVPDFKSATWETVKAETVKGEEDCDDKAKKPIEIKEDSISLSGDAGCTLDE